MTDMKYWIQLVDRQYSNKMLHKITLPITPATGTVKMTAKLNIIPGASPVTGCAH